MKQKGGIRILPEFETINKALSYIINNSIFEIFTENTTSGITILSTLKPEFQEGSPCRISRVFGFDKPIIKFLFKFSLWGKQDGFNRTGSTTITNITSTDSFLREFNIQHDVFIKSLSDPTSLFEPLCPALITGICNIKESIKNSIKRKILGNLKQRTIDENDSNIIQTLFENDISVIIMEFMEGYKLLSKLEPDEQTRKYKIFSLYELSKLHSYGYRHGDFHNGNVLINTICLYFTNEENKDLQGRAIIIDFGLAETIHNSSRDRVRNIMQYEHSGITIDLTLETEFKRLDNYRNKISKDFIKTIHKKGWNIHNLQQYDLLGFNRIVLRGGLKPNDINVGSRINRFIYEKNKCNTMLCSKMTTNPRIEIKNNKLIKIKEKIMTRQPREYKSWWSSPEEEILALDELRSALDKQENDKDYNKKIHDSVLKMVDELGSNENFQNMITGMFTPPVFIGENSASQDELAKLLEEYDENVGNDTVGNDIVNQRNIYFIESDSNYSGSIICVKPTRLKRTIHKRRTSIKKTRKRK